MKDSMYIISTGMVCPVGFSAETACAAMRAGVSNFRELPYVNSIGEAVIGSAVPSLQQDFEGDDRVVELLLAALRDCLADVDAAGEIPIVLGLSERGRPGGSSERAEWVLSQLVGSETGARLDPRRSQVITTGHSACLEGIIEARRLIERGEATTCIVCGVDSYLNANSLRWLEETRRLKTEELSDGVIPGECAAAVLLGREEVREGQRRMAVIGLGTMREDVGVLSTDALRGEGLAGAARAGLADAGLAIHEVSFRISDMTGESYGFKEQALVLSKLMRIRREDFPIWHCAEFVGDIGAASGAAQLVMAHAAFSKGYSPGDSAICFTSSVTDNRATAILRWIQ